MSITTTGLKNKYIDLKVNGRLFPSWIIANFKEYKLPELVKTDEDPCFVKTKDSLKQYQTFLSKYLDYNSIYKDLLIYHGLGSGKTGSTINIYNMLYNYTPGWNVYILLKATLKHSTWIGELNKWISENEKKNRMDNIKFISYDAPNAEKAFMDAVKSSDISKKSLYIIDEAHGFISNVYSNVRDKQGRRAQTIYDHIIQDKKENDKTRVILLSATPAINKPFELGLMFNLLRPDIFPKSEIAFDQLYVSATAYPVLNNLRKNNFQRRILGLVSYYIGATPDYYASKRTNYVDVPMSEYQEEIYDYFEQIEEKIAYKSKKAGKKSSSYKSYTRQCCNFVFPPIEQNITGELRPRQSKLLMQNEKNIDDIRAAELKFTTAFTSWLNKKANDDKKNNYTIVDDIKTFHNEFDDNYEEFHNSKTKKSSLYVAMHMCSAKMLYIIFKIIVSPGPVLVYSNYVHMEGLEIFKLYLNQFGFYEYDTANPNKNVPNHSFVEYSGDIPKETRIMNKNIFNDPNNTYGEFCKIVMMSPAGSEGVSLENVRQVHLMEPYWHEVRMTQMIGRAVRLCSHKRLPQIERHVEIFRYKSIRTKKNKVTTDQYIEDAARSKEGLLQSFLDAIKESAIDCNLFKNHNFLAQKYNCFQFEEQSLLEKQVGPAYKEDLYDDLDINNGSNSPDVSVSRIKVIKINAVKQLSPDSETDIKYSESQPYWYHIDSQNVYDYENHYLVGKVGIDESGLPKKLNKDTYIIDRIIPIPLIENY